jgi:hypothetical protein
MERRVSYEANSMLSAFHSLSMPKYKSESLVARTSLSIPRAPILAEDAYSLQ